MAQHDVRTTELTLTRTMAAKAADIFDRWLDATKPGSPWFGTKKAIVNPVVDAYYREHPDERRFIGPSASLDDLLTELGLIRELLTSGAELSDIQLFSQLKNLNEIKVALAALPGEAAARMIREVDQLLETVFASSKFGL